MLLPLRGCCCYYCSVPAVGLLQRNYQRIIKLIAHFISRSFAVPYTTYIACAWCIGCTVVRIFCTFQIAARQQIICISYLPFAAAAALVFLFCCFIASLSLCVHYGCYYFLRSPLSSLFIHLYYKEVNENEWNRIKSNICTVWFIVIAGQ